MAIISFDPDVLIDFLPEYGGNRDSDDPCVVRLKYVSYSRSQHYARVLAQKIGNTSKSSKIAEASMALQRKQFVENVESISGYFIGEREITEPGEFYDTADTALITEIIEAMESSAKLTEGQRKN